MEVSTSTWMLIFFILFLVMSIWKIWAFLPNKQLADDDKTEESENELRSLMFKVINDKRGELDEMELFLQMNEDENFNSELFWRFNLNRLKQLLNVYYMQNPSTHSIKEIYSERNS